MKILSTLRKRTQHGVSVWSFCFNEETNQYFAVGGENLKAIAATDLKHLRQLYNNFVRYGYATKLPVERVYINDPWESSLPVSMQRELEMLSA